jgi:predicted SAM-dependent methyltransferases
MGLSALLARTAVRQLVGDFTGEQFGELYFNDSFGKALPLGVYYRCWRG